MLSIGIVGLPNVGKSTLFKALTKRQVDIQNYPFCTIEPNVGIVEVPDERLELLAKMSHSAKIVPTAIQFTDIAGLVKGASQGEGLGNQFLANIREADAIMQVVRAFEGTDIIHVSGQPQPKDDIEIISLELIFKDLDTLKKHLPKVEKNIKGGDKEAALEHAFLSRLIPFLEQGKPAKDIEKNEKEAEFLKALNLLSAKPVLYVINCSSDKKVIEYPASASPALELDVKLENELSELDFEAAKEMREALPHPKNSIDELISACYTLLGLETFLTTGEDETRAWTITKGSKAPQAAGKIHTDFEKGFIRADVVFWKDLLEASSWASAREKGLLKTEGKEYVVKDGDVIEFKTN
ncbi:MAG TPA: redox-regulated ATPase YchF [Candidatus Portnoybacteria bacterium]|nr:redox-regulated ATPase YchF [Candidatus Portnoybacteria bacterium]